MSILRNLSAFAILLIPVLSFAANKNAINEWLSKDAQFDFSSCEETLIKRGKTYNSYSNPYSAEETKEINLQASSCDEESKRAFVKGFLNSGLQDKIHAKGSREGISVLSAESLQAIYSDFLQNPYFPREIIETQSCFHRAAFMTFYLRSRGINVGQVIANGDMNIPSVLYPEDNVHWTTHTALFLYNTKGERIVIDPSLSPSPITIKEWSEQLTKNSAKKKLDLRFQQQRFFNDNRKDHPEYLMRVTGAMMNDIFHLLDQSLTKPERISDDLVPTLAEYAKLYRRKNPRMRFLKTKIEAIVDEQATNISNASAQ